MRGVACRRAWGRRGEMTGRWVVGSISPAMLAVVFGAEDAVLGGEEGGEFEAGDGFAGFGGEDVDGAVAVGSRGRTGW